MYCFDFLPYHTRSYLLTSATRSHQMGCRWGLTDYSLRLDYSIDRMWTEQNAFHV